MARLPRFFLPELTVGDVILDGTEAHHLLNVRRLKQADQVELFDGAGKVGIGTITRTSRRDVSISVETVEHTEPDGSTITLAIGFPKPDRARWLVEKLTELGVARVIPLQTEHSGSSGKRLKVHKLQQYVIDACKQSRRNVLMRIDEPMPLKNVVESNSASRLLVADVSGLSPESSDCAANTVVFIGPEAGFSNFELEELKGAGAQPIRFAGNILRVETAALAAAAILVSR